MSDDEEKHKVLKEVDAQSEGEESEEVADIDSSLKGVGLEPDPEDNINVLNAAERLKENSKKD